MMESSASFISTVAIKIAALFHALLLALRHEQHHYHNDDEVYHDDMKEKEIAILAEHVIRGVSLSIGTSILTIILELFSLDYVQKILEQNKKKKKTKNRHIGRKNSSSSTSSTCSGLELYLAAIQANVRNHFLLGWPFYVISVPLFCRANGELNIVQRVYCILFMLSVHSIGYYTVHRLFHTFPKTLYRFHRFHHKFSAYVTPMVANAVSSVEYIFAYMIPFIVSMPLCHPDPVCVRISVAIISFMNLIIHTPCTCIIMRYMNLPPWLVTTDDHLEHHRKFNTKFAAPTFNIDYFVSLLSSPTSSSSSFVGTSSINSSKGIKKNP